MFVTLCEFFAYPFYSAFRKRQLAYGIKNPVQFLYVHSNGCSCAFKRSLLRLLLGRSSLYSFLADQCVNLTPYRILKFFCRLKAPEHEIETYGIRRNI